MDIKQQYGTRFHGVGTATAATATVTQGLCGLTDLYVTDVSASSDVGTALLTIYNGTRSGTALWQNTITTAPFNFNFTQPLRASATVEVFISGASASLKTVNVAGYII